MRPRMGILPSESPGRETFRLDTIRAMPAGCMETLSITFAVMIAERFFGAPDWAKAWLVAAPPLGLFLSLFLVQMVRKSGWSVNVTVAAIWGVSALCLVLASLGADSMEMYQHT